MPCYKTCVGKNIRQYRTEIAITTKELNMTDNEIIKNTAALLAKEQSIEKIYLISNKISTSGELTSFKLALIVNDSVKSISELECRLYMETDSELPYDIVLYKTSEWDELKDEIGTFAWKINNSGVLIYG